MLVCGSHSDCDRFIKSPRKVAGNGRVYGVKKQGLIPLGVEGMDSGEWVLIDLGNIIVHVMQPKIREFYQLEKLWAVDAEV